MNDRQRAPGPQVDRRLQWLIIGAVALAVVIVVVIVGGGGDDSGGGDTDAAADEVQALFEGVTQQGFSVGEDDAPVTLVEYGDLQCPFCAEASGAVVEPLIEDYVAGGDLRIVFEPLAFIGEDSVEGAQMAAAASLQDRGVQFVELFYRQQGAENTGYVDEDFLTEIGEGVEGLDVDQAREDRSSDEVAEIISLAERAAQDDQVDSTPTFFIGETDGKMEQLDAGPSDLDAFRTEIERLAGGG